MKDCNALRTVTDLITEHLQAKFLDIDAIVGEDEVSIIVASFLPKKKKKTSDNLLFDSYSVGYSYWIEMFFMPCE